MTDTGEKIPQVYYQSQDDRARLHRLIAHRIRCSMLYLGYYNKGKSEDSNIFDIVDPDEEASMLIRDLVLFGFLPETALSPGDGAP